MKLPVYTELWSSHDSVLHDTNPASPPPCDDQRGGGPGAEELPTAADASLP